MEQPDPSSTIDSIAAAIVAAQHSQVDSPTWSTVLIVIGIAGLAIAVIPFFIDFPERLHRQIYWFGFAVGTLFMALALSPRGWGTSLAMCIVGAAAAVILAFFYDGSLLKIGNRYISYTITGHRDQGTAANADAQCPATAPPPDSYLGVVTARNHWWLIAFLTCGLSASLYLFGWTWVFSTSVVVAVVGAALSGFDDAARGLSIGRGQKVQFAIASIASLMMFALPLLAYLAAYSVGKRRPMAHGKHAPDGDSSEPGEPE